MSPRKSFRVLYWLVVLAASLVSLQGVYAASPADAELSSAKLPTGYPVMVDGYTVFFIHENMGAASAEQRADAISERIRALARYPKVGPDELKTSDESYGTAVKLGDQIIVLITDDEASDAGLPRQALAAYSMSASSKMRCSGTATNIPEGISCGPQPMLSSPWSFMSSCSG